MVRQIGMVFLGLLLAAPAWASAGHVSFLEGRAFRAAHGQRVSLKLGSPIEAGDLLTTAAKSRLEVTLDDKSILRVGPSSKLQLHRAAFGDAGRTFSAKLFLGHIWAKVSSALGGENKFEITTDRAVAGVRGTTFRVDAHHDTSVLVRVFAGAVAVAGGLIPRPLVPQVSGASSKGKRVQIAGPHQVSKKQWERIVGAQMQIKVSADGSFSEPTKFAETEACKDPWTRWNRSRDGDPCPQ